MSELYDWIHDDITWCANECSNTHCERNLANRLTKGGMYSAAMFKGTETCPLTEKYKWREVHGYVTAGGDPVYVCGKCGKGMHVYGIEHREALHICPDCSAINVYEGEE